MPEISVIMPIYRTKEQYLRSAVESILSQSFGDYEFLILDDSPCDASLREVVQSYRDARIKYVASERTLGVAGSYNHLLELACCDYVAVMNHDDQSLPRRLARQYSYLQCHPEVGLVGTGYKKFGEINRFKTIKNPAGDAVIRASLLFKSSIHHPTIMFRRRLVAEAGIRYNENFISLNDRQFYYDISRRSRLANIPDVLYRYRFHKDMVSKRCKPEIYREQCLFHDMWFKSGGIELSAEEKSVFDEYAAQGRCHIRDAEVLSRVEQVLAKLAAENARRQIVPAAEFSVICAQYLVKRCLNAVVYGGINSAEILERTILPVRRNRLLQLCNLALHWRGMK